MYTSRNEYLNEKLFKWCIPQWKIDSEWNGVEREYFRRCMICGKSEYEHSLRNPLIDFSTWEGFGKLWEKCNEQDWWKELEYYLDLNSGIFLNVMYISPDTFSNAVFKFLKERTS
jgi:hypothetical protein